MTVAIRLLAREEDARLPPSFGMAQRGAGADADPFFPANYLKPTGTFELAGPSRDVGPVTPERRELKDGELLVLQLEDGSEFITSAAGLAETLERLHPDWLVDGVLPLERLSQVAGATSDRGIGDVVGGIVKKVFTFLADGPEDLIVKEAREQLDKLGLKAADMAVTWAGTKALMWAIESRLKPEAGFYAWSAGDGMPARLEPPDETRLRKAAAERQPMLVFVHGTGSSTLGSFHDLAEGDGVLWAQLRRRFTGGIYALEHRTFSQSPIENAIALAQALPAGARVSLVSHSRGGLVADLLCADSLASEIDHYVRAANLPGLGTMDPDSERSAAILKDLGDAHAEQRDQLRALAVLLREKQFVVERYVRVASPAAGTKLAGGNLDLFLSGLLSLVGRVPVLAGNPWYLALKRIVIEIAKNRTDAHLVPGIEAMLPDSPMASFLPRLAVRPGLSMALIAGDIEGGSLLKRLGVFFTDTLIFDAEDNDLVVNTSAMLAGVAQKASARVMFDRAASVSHFNYFENLGTRSALRDWLVSDEPANVTAFRALPAPEEVAAALAAAARAVTAAATAADLQRPVAVVLPGVMGSHLRVGDGEHSDRVWFALPAIMGGKLADIAWASQGVEADGLFDLFYGDFCERLAQTHRVERFAYDWRQPMDVLAERLGEFLDRLLQQTTQPVRLVAHSMGGLVVRACIHKRRPVMDALMARDGARLIMLGTPNQGAHSMVANLLGKGDTLRTLVRLDLKHSMQEVLDIVAGFRGALQLLPRPGFVDMFQGQPEGGELHDYGRAQTWAGFRPLVKDFWFGNGVVARVDQATLDEASWLWQEDARQGNVPALPASYAARSAYVFGVAPNTPCGLRAGPGNTGLKLVGTPHGDGTVTWASGRIDGFGKHFYLPAAHGDLLATKTSFDALLELITTGDTARLATTPPAVRDIAAPRPVSYDAGPPQATSNQQALLALLGGTLQRRDTPARLRRLSVQVCAKDLRFVDHPIMVGHYEQDPIVAAERIIDEELLDHDLSARQRLGLYPGRVGTAIAVLRAPNEAERLRGSLRGAVVTGLGPYDGSLDMGRLTEAVRAGAIRFLLQVMDVLGTGPEHRELPLATLLIGFNSSASMAVSSSVEALLRGVMEANARFHDITHSDLHIARLNIVELYQDTAITAVYALRELQPQLAAWAAQNNTELVCADELQSGEGVRPRLFDASGDGYWPRLIVSSTDDGTLHYVYVGRRARAEAVHLQRQPGLVERLVERQIRNPVWDENFGRALFQLMVPNAFKEAARQLRQAVIVVDRSTANLPWELMLADTASAPGERSRPMSIAAPFVRQLATVSFRQSVHQNTGRLALVVGDPSTQGFEAAFKLPDGQPIGRLPSLAGAREEAEAVERLLRAHNHEVKALRGGQDAATVLSALYEQPWRIVHISAHGVFRMQHVDGRPRSGVVLSDGLLLTAAEIAAMERVPDVVVLNCCHLGTVDLGSEGNKLAASIATELIDNGVRCVLVAGWAVTDSLASTFGQTFYDALLRRRLPFGEAVFAARKALWTQAPQDITWGAFQAYGQPDWVAEPRMGGSTATLRDRFVSPDELIDAITSLRVRAARRLGAGGDTEPLVQQLLALLDSRCVPAWRQLPEVHSALGTTWMQLNELARARDELLAAVRGEDRHGRVPLRDVERLANAEARLGEQTGDLLLIQSGIERLQGIQRMLATEFGQDADDDRRQGERTALLGSAHKRMASVAARALLKARRHGVSFEQNGLDAELHDLLRQSLAASAAAYEAAESPSAPAGAVPYQTLNRLALKAAGEMPKADLDADRELARACAHQAELDYAQRPDVWNAVMVPEALLVEHLLDRKLFLPGAAGDAVLDALRAAYAAALRNVPVKPGELDSVVKQMELLAMFLMATALSAGEAAGEARAARRLLDLCQSIQPGYVLPAWLDTEG
jgi:hypothetical protein